MSDEQVVAIIRATVREVYAERERARALADMERAQRRPPLASALPTLADGVAWANSVLRER